MQMAGNRVRRSARAKAAVLSPQQLITRKRGHMVSGLWGSSLRNSFARFLSGGDARPTAVELPSLTSFNKRSQSVGKASSNNVRKDGCQTEINRNSRQRIRCSNVW